MSEMRQELVKILRDLFRFKFGQYNASFVLHLVFKKKKIAHIFHLHVLIHYLLILKATVLFNLLSSYSQFKIPFNKFRISVINQAIIPLADERTNMTKQGKQVLRQL